MSTKFTYECEEKIAKQYDTPTEHVVSDGELLIKALAEKQASKVINLEDQLNQKKEFQKSAFVPITAFASGKTTLEEFKKCTEFVNSIEELKSLGLSQREIELFYDSQKGKEYVFVKHRHVCREILQKQINDLKNKVENLKADHRKVLERNQDDIPRHLKDLAFSVKPDSKETKLYKFALSCTSKKQDIIPDHPINTLQKIERKLFEHLDSVPVPPLAKRRKKAKKYIDQEEKTKVIQTKFYKEGDSKWDMKEKPSEKPSERKKVKTYTCKPQHFYTIQNNKIVKLSDSIKLNEQKTEKQENEECDSLKEKLSEEEIKNIPHFENYEKGEPSKILYLKNLSKSIKEEDLINIYSKFDTEKEKISYKLLTGKMKGQAFLTFYNINQATKCLEATNGLILKGKPIIVQYGKNKT